jgi:hypothetical protein
MSLLFARSCLVVAAFWARTSLVRDDVEDIWFAETWAEDAEEGTAVGRVDTDVEGAAPIYRTSSEASRLLI